MNYICELYVTCDMYVKSCMILVVCWLNRDPSRYSTDYRVYMGSSMIVRPLVDYHCTCALINWTVLLQLASEQDLTLIATCVFKTKVFVFQNQFLATNSYIYRCLNLKYASDHFLYAQLGISGGKLSTNLGVLFSSSIQRAIVWMPFT